MVYKNPLSPISAKIRVTELSSLRDLCSFSDEASAASSLQLRLPAGCEAACSGHSNMVPECGERRAEGRVVTNVTYFILRMFATMALACVFIILDAQTIQMCKMEDAAGNKGSYGRQGGRRFCKTCHAENDKLLGYFLLYT